MVKSNLAAWTPDEKNPPYVSINCCQNRTVEITVRGRGIDALGATASVALTEDEFSELLGDLFNSIIVMDHDLTESDKSVKRQLGDILKG